MSVTVLTLSAEDRSRIKRFNDVLSTALGLGDVNRINARFRANHRISDGDPVLPALDEILQAHCRRVAGQGSPAECDQVTKRVLA